MPLSRTMLPRWRSPKSSLRPHAPGGGRVGGRNGAPCACTGQPPAQPDDGGDAGDELRNHVCVQVLSCRSVGGAAQAVARFRPCRG